MSHRETDTLLELVEQNDTMATALPATLAELALEDPAYADRALSVTTAALTQLAETGGEPHRVTERLPTLFVRYPDLAAQTFEPLSRMAAHGDTDIRREGIRCLGCLGAQTPVDTTLVADHVTDGLTDETRTVQQAALWSLTKLGLAAPGVLTPRRDALVAVLGTRPPTFSSTDASATLRRRATEALAANALGELRVAAHEPCGDPCDGMEAAAAWAIQRCVADRGLPVDVNAQCRQTTSLDEDHGIAGHVAETLAACIRAGGDTTLVQSAILALGCLAPGQPDLRVYIGHLHEVIEQREGERARLAEAARHALDNGPFTPTNGSLLNPNTNAEVTLAVDEEGLWIDAAPSDISVSLDVASDLFEHDECSAREATAEVGDTETAVARIRVRHDQDGTIKIDDRLRERIGASTDDTVTVRPTSTIPARMVELACPANAPVRAADIDTQPVRETLAEQRFEVGDTIVLSVVTDPDRLAAALAECGRHILLDATVEHYVTRRLPLRVVSSDPSTATRITENTKLVLAEDQTLCPDDWVGTTNHDLPHPLLPFALVRSEIKRRNKLVSEVDDCGFDPSAHVQELFDQRETVYLRHTDRDAVRGAYQTVEERRLERQHEKR